MLFGGGAGDLRLRVHRVVRRAALRQPTGLQALREELPRHRRRRRRRDTPGSPRHLRPSRSAEHRAPRDPRRRAPRHQLQRRRRGPPPLQLPLRHHPPPCCCRFRHGGCGVFRGGRATWEHARRHARVRRHNSKVQSSVTCANLGELNATKQRQHQHRHQRLQVQFLNFSLFFFLLLFMIYSVILYIW